MRANQRIIFVPTVLAASLVVGLLCIAGFKFLIGAYCDPIEASVFDQMLDRLNLALLLFFSMVAGASRSAIFHPAANAKYRQWLITSTWQPRLPLPLGPITLAWQDALLLGAVTLLAWYLAPPALMLWPAIVFLSVFVLQTALILWQTKQHAAVIVIGYLAAAVIQLWFAPRILLLGVIALYAIEHLALRRSLWEFPWAANTNKPSPVKVGWPFEQLAPRAVNEPQSRIGPSLITGTMVGAWAFSISRIVHLNDPVHGLEEWRAFAGLFASFLCFGRLIMYTAHYPGSINFWGRLATGHLIIPKYDRVFIGPLCTFFGSVILMVAMWLSAVDEPLQVAVCLAVPVFITMMVKPSLADWKLTGAHQIRRILTGEVQSRQRRRQIQLNSLAE